MCSRWCARVGCGAPRAGCRSGGDAVLRNPPRADDERARLAQAEGLIHATTRARHRLIIIAAPGGRVRGRVAQAQTGREAEALAEISPTRTAQAWRGPRVRQRCRRPAFVRSMATPSTRVHVGRGSRQTGRVHRPAAKGRRSGSGGGRKGNLGRPRRDVGGERGTLEWGGECATKRRSVETRGRSATVQPNEQWTGKKNTPLTPAQLRSTPHASPRGSHASVRSSLKYRWSVGRKSSGFIPSRRISSSSSSMPFSPRVLFISSGTNSPASPRRPFHV